MGTTEEEARTVYGDPDEFAGEMVKMINDKEFSDIRFIIGQERTTIYAHKSILATRCEVFRAMFADSALSDGSPLILADIKPIIFMAILEYIYTNCCSLSTLSVIEVLHSAIEYGLDGLRRICVRFMLESIEVKTVCDFLQAALTFEQLSLRDECMALIEGKTKAVFASKGFNEMSEETLVFILKSDKLDMEESDILEKVKEWANISSVVNGTTLAEAAKEVIKHVRFPLLDTEILTRADDENKVKGYIPENLIATAWKFHALKKPFPGDPQTTPRKGTLPKQSLKCIGLEN